MSETSDIKNLVELAHMQPGFFRATDGREFILRPTGNGAYGVENITPAGSIRPAPAYIIANIKIATSKSLIDYVNRFKTADTVIFADPEANKIVACIDYHQASADNADPTTAAKAGLNTHTATLVLRHSNEWDTWVAHNDMPIEQKKFARGLEEQKRDFFTPDGATLLEAILDMERNIHVQINRQIDDAGSDRGRSSYSKETTGTSLPQVWSVAIPVYFGENPTAITAYVREGNEEGKILVGYKLSRIENTREQEFTRIVSDVGVATGVPVMLGSRTDPRL
jgi:uncharacterized protein YfdQ (DUF2303 family)